jgi:sugar phosphate permease
MSGEQQNKPFYGRVLVFYLLFIYAVQMGFALYSRSVIYPFMLQELPWTRAQIMLGHTGSSMLFGFASPVVAYIINKYNAKLSITLGAGLIVITNTLMGFYGTNYTFYVILSIINGLGLCMSSLLATQTIVIDWFHVRRAMALGIVLAGGSIGGFIFPQAVTYIIESSGGVWRLGWFTCAAASFCVMILNLILVKNKPSDLGQYPDGIEPGSESVETGRRRTFRSKINWKLKDAVRTPSLWLIIMASAGNLFLWHIMQSQGPFHLQDRGYDAAFASFLYSLAIGSSIIGRFAIGAIGDYVETRYLYAFGILCILLGGIAFWYASPERAWVAYFYPILSGIGFGTAFLCRSLLVSNYFGSGSFATISGFTTPIGSLITAFAPPVAGYVFDTTNSYLPILIFAWCLAAVAIFASLSCTPPSIREELPAD